MVDPTAKMKLNEKGKKSEKEKGLGPMLLSFATSTTAHGLNRIADSADFRIRVAWFVVWLGVVVGFVVMVFNLATLYMSKPTSTSISVAYKESITFPGVTICNLNMILKSRAKYMTKNSAPIMEMNRTQSDIKKDFFSSAQTSMKNVNTSVFTVDPVASKVADILTDLNNVPLATRMQQGYQLKEFLIYCNWAGLMCTKQSFFGSLYWKQSWNWKYGNCYTFNGYTNVDGTSVEPLVSSASAGSEGLTLILNINRMEYMPDLTTEEGIRVLIGDQDEPLYPVEKGNSIEPGVSASISIRKSIVEREDTYNNGSCKATSTQTVKYSVEDCVANCKAAKQMNVCNCTESKYAGLINNSTICATSSEKICMMLVNSNFSKGALECRTACPPPCKSIMFQKTVTQSKIYSEGYLSLYSAKLPKSYVSENIIQLQIFFEDQTVQTITSGVYYKFDNLISDVGGQLGLWIGVSAVTCMEFLALVWNMVMYIMYRRRKKNEVQFLNDK